MTKDNLLKMYEMKDKGVQVTEIAKIFDMPISKMSEEMKKWSNINDYLAMNSTPLSALGGLDKNSRV